MFAELAVLAFLGMSHALLMFDRVDSENACLLAMCDADSGCVPKGCSIDQNNRIGCGYFRLNIYQFRQCYQPGKKEDEDEEVAWINCAEDYGCSSECIRVLGSRFRVKCYGKSDCETLARIHDGGANGCRDRNTAYYWKRVGDICGGRCNKPIFVRH
ncbi:Invertebrate LYSozyme [Trichostrongylus colubriformis]|uniref:lysozyme n=1 Tax=Trichostrongylus colubriformis TaxID=6319 RepID=A0AAN8FU87_TRICO